jgi:hypothetical protein
MRLFARELSARGKLAKAVELPANHIHVKTLMGETIHLDVKPADTIWEVKLMLHAHVVLEGMMQDVHPRRFVLIFAGQQLPNNSTLAECLVNEQSTMHLVVGVDNVRHG